MFTELCTVEADTSRVPKIPRQGPNGDYYVLDYDIVMSFGLTELKAQICWIENAR